ncbi:MAG: histone deacetylase [Planctomycetaceae bacterium]
MPLLYSDPIFLRHDTGAHPESAARLQAVSRKLEEFQDLDLWTLKKAVPAETREVSHVHDLNYIASVREFALNGGGRIEADTVVCPDSYNVALHASGTAIDATNEVLGGNDNQAVCLIRPPGHHALPKSAMGFCLFNHVAVAAQHAIERFHLSRVLIVDWDVHHGNGTQEIFYESPNVYFMSVHRWPFYPGTGDVNETGHGPGLGTTFNLPLPFGVSRQSYCEQFARLLDDVASKCQPELILISAGFDAHAADPIGSLGLESEDFSVLTKTVLDVASQFCQGKVVSLLEGGYNTNALAESVLCHLRPFTERQNPIKSS